MPMFGFGRAGGMRSLSLLANKWVDLGHEVTFMCHVSSTLPYYPTTANIYYYDDVGRHCAAPEISDSKPPSIYSGMIFLWRALNKLEQKFDVAIANFFPTAFSLKYSKIAAKKFYYVQAYEPGFFTGTDRNSRLARSLAKRSYDLGLNIIVNARVYYDYANIDSTCLALPPVDFSVFKPKDHPGVIQHNPIKIGMIGRSVGWKGGDYVLQAFEKLCNVSSLDREFSLHVAFGSTELSKQYGAHLEYPNNDAELSAFYREMDIFVAVPTLQYGAVHYPVVEALASGTPLITTGYYPSTSANCWLVKPHSADSIASAIETIVENPSLAVERSERGLVDPKENCVNRVALQFLEYLH